MCSETSEAVGTTWEHAQSEFQNFFENKNPPNDVGYLFIAQWEQLISSVVFQKRGSWYTNENIIRPSLVSDFN